MRSNRHNAGFGFGQSSPPPSVPQGTTPASQRDVYDRTQHASPGVMHNQYFDPCENDSVFLSGTSQQGQPRQGPTTTSVGSWVDPNPIYNPAPTISPLFLPPRQQTLGMAAPLAQAAQLATTAPRSGYLQSPQTYLQAGQSRPVLSSDAPIEVIAGMICYTHSTDGNGRFFKCTASKCNGISFPRMVDFERHYNSLHSPQPPEFWCTIPGCKRNAPFPRKDKMEAHTRTKHDQVYSDCEEVASDEAEDDGEF